MSIKKTQVHSFFAGLCTLGFILLSKSVIFGSLYEYYTMVFLAMCTIILFALGHHITKGNFRAFIIFSFIVFLIGVVHYKDLFDNGTFLFLSKRIVYILLAFLYCSSCSKEQFKKYFVYVMVAIAIVSLLFTALKIISPTFLNSITHWIYLPNGSRNVGNIFYISGRSMQFMELRNYGIFWEPGGYQIFLSIALLLIISEKEINIYHFIIIITTLLTTQSTTGYLILSVILILYYKKISTRFKGYMKYIIIALLLIALIIIIYSNNISSKLTLSEDNGSLIQRTGDLEAGIKLFFYYPLFGYGNTDIATRVGKSLFNRFSNSNGLLSMLFVYGLPFTILYFFFSIKNLNKLLCTSKVKEFICMILVLLFIQIGEESLALIIMFCFIFDFSGRNKGVYNGEKD